MLPVGEKDRLLFLSFWTKVFEDLLLVHKKNLLLQFLRMSRIQEAFSQKVFYDIPLKVKRESATSFKEVVATSSQWFNEARKIMISSMEWEEPELDPPQSSINVQFPIDTLAKLREPWKLTLMGKCLGIYVRPSFITMRTRAMWRPKGSLEVIDIGKNVYLFRFSDHNDYERALFGGPWFILDHYLMLTKWKPNFRPSSNPFETISIWIRFPELPVEYYNKDALFEIAQKAGKPIRVDYATDHIILLVLVMLGSVLTSNLTNR